MEKLSTFQVNDNYKLFELAKKLNQRNFFKNFLNDTQFKLLRYLLQLNNFIIWDNFLQGNCFVEIIKDIDKDQTKENNVKSNNQENEEDSNGAKVESEETKPIETMEIDVEEGLKTIKRLALHIRYLLWEKAIDYYYCSQLLDKSDNTIDEVNDDYELLDTLDEVLEPQIQSQPHNIPEPIKASIRDEEDDFDDDDDEETDIKKLVVLRSNDNAPNEEITYNQDNQLLLRIPTSLLLKQEDNEDNLEDQEKLVKEFNKVYHNFEYDKETLIKRRKLEKSDLSLETTSHKNAKHQDASSNNQSNVELAFATGSSLKHLLNTIQQQRDQIPLNDYELRALFMDVKKNRGKWANDDRIGQEELYDACEKVVVELRSYTEHSTPFLNKVSKREAPNYGLIIKKPMDLNTVMKKLKNLQYNSKQEFVDDIMLIWTNCLTYNSDPKHFLRVHAIAMQKKSLKLIPHIPNIIIRNRSEIEKDEEKDELNNDASKGKASKKGRKRTRNNEIKLEYEPTTKSPESMVATPLDIEPTPFELTPLPEEAVGETADANVDDDEEEEENEEINDENNNMLNEEDEIGPELQAWRILTAKSRAHYCGQRALLFDNNNKLNLDAPAIVRESSEMSHFNDYLRNQQVVSKGNLLEKYEPYLLEYDIMGGLPGIKYEGIDDDIQDKQEQRIIDSYINEKKQLRSSGFMLSTENGLNHVYLDNIFEMQEIRKICFKISLIRQMQTQQFVHHTQMRQPEVETLKETDIDAISKLPNHDPNSQEVQFRALRRNIAKIAMQTGFEVTEPRAINVLTQLAERYLSNLIKSLKTHHESTSSNTLNRKEMLLVSLIENGVNKPDDLYTFVSEKLLQQHNKLRDLKGKLSNFLKELLRPGLENFNEKSFGDNSEQFMTGDFSNDLGDDFFGFKELGLDKEFNMLSSSIPIYLLHSRLNSSYNSNGNAIKINKFNDLNEYTNQALRGAEIDQQIGILKPFFTNLLEKSKAHYIKVQKKNGLSTELPGMSHFMLIDDDDLPQKQRNIRPRLPPTGKIAAPKKKPLVGSFFLEESTPDPATAKADPNPLGYSQTSTEDLDAKELEMMIENIQDTTTV